MRKSSLQRPPIHAISSLAVSIPRIQTISPRRQTDAGLDYAWPSFDTAMSSRFMEGFLHDHHSPHYLLRLGVQALLQAPSTCRIPSL